MRSREERIGELELLVGERDDRIAQLEAPLPSGGHGGPSSPSREDFARLLRDSSELHVISAEREALASEVQRLREQVVSRGREAADISDGQLVVAVPNTPAGLEARVAELELQRERQRARDELRDELRGELELEIATEQMQATNVQSMLTRMADADRKGDTSPLEMPPSIDGIVPVVTLEFKRGVTSRGGASAGRGGGTPSFAKNPPLRFRNPRPRSSGLVLTGQVPSPSEASQAWQMSFSPDWKTGHHGGPSAEWLSRPTRQVPWLRTEGADRPPVFSMGRHHGATNGTSRSKTPVLKETDSSPCGGGSPPFTTSAASATSPPNGLASSTPASARRSSVERWRQR